MPNTREKLIELLCEVIETDGCSGDCFFPPCYLVKACADHLIANGVTVQKWIRAEEELPGQEEVGKYYAQYGEHPKYIVMIAGAVQSTVLAYDGEDFYDDNAGEIYKVTHWMPLPAAPNNKK